MARVSQQSNTPGNNMDDEPWYRQFWPWFLIALPGSVVVAGLVTVYIASRHADDLVVDNYYKDGLAINRQIEKRSTAEKLGIDIRLLLLDQRVQARISGATASAVDLQFSHPLEADRDFSVTLQRTAPELYDAMLPAAVDINWHWRIDSMENSWRLDGTLREANFLNREPTT